MPGSGPTTGGAILQRLAQGRDRQIRPPSFYKKYFWSTKVEAPAEIHEAIQLVRLANFPALPRRLDGSRVAQVGSHAELMAKGGPYAELYSIQAAAYR